MDCVYLDHKISALITTIKEFTYSQSDRQLDDIFEGDNTFPHEKYVSDK